ncbi:MAG: molybdenum cofactor guanylyltransferase [Flavobacteriia bacterium]|nr:molybdenum cofactor guanylyltransferase [Flavobacteriia bacterium]
MKYTAIILAGGKSSRMGTDKGLVLLNGKPMVSYLIDLFQSLNIPIILVANNEFYSQFDLPVYSDIIQEKGPLSGIYTGLKASQTEKNIIVSCDIPFLSQRIIELLLKENSNNLITVVQCGGKIHPLIGVYSKEIEAFLFESLTQNKLKVRSFIHELAVKIIDLDEEELDSVEEVRNINTLNELKEIENGK